MVERLDSRDINKKVAEALIKSGSLDSIIVNRASAMSNYERIIEGIHSTKKNMVQGQISFFNVAATQGYKIGIAPDIKEFSHEILLNMEKEILGFYISGNPLEKYRDLIKQKTNMTTTSIKEINEENTSQKVIETTKVKIIGMISKMKISTTKKNAMMAFITIEDLYSSVEVIVFPKIYEKVYYDLVQDKVVYIRGRLSVQEDEDTKLIAEEILPIEEVMSDKKIYVKVSDFHNSTQVQIIERLTKSTGNAKLYFYDEKSGKTMVKDNQNIDFNLDIIKKLQDIASKENVKIV